MRIRIFFRHSGQTLRYTVLILLQMQFMNIFFIFQNISSSQHNVVDFTQRKRATISIYVDQEENIGRYKDLVIT